MKRGYPQIPQTAQIRPTRKETRFRIVSPSLIRAAGGQRLEVGRWRLGPHARPGGLSPIEKLNRAEWGTHANRRPSALRQRSADYPGLGLPLAAWACLSVCARGSSPVLGPCLVSWYLCVSSERRTFVFFVSFVFHSGFSGPGLAACGLSRLVNE